MKLGAEPKKIVAVVALFGVAGIVFWMNSSSDAPPAPAATHRPAVASAAVAAPTTDAPDTTGMPAKKRVPQGRASLSETTYKLPPPPSDPSKIDPTLRMDLLAKVQSVEPEGGVRNLFQVTAAPPPPTVAAKGQPLNVPPIHPNGPTPMGTASIQRPGPPPGPPPPPPINLKYYGYSTKTSDGEKKAFFLDGDDIIVASEGEIIKKQYKVVRITTTAVEMEDTHSRTIQKLPIQPEAAPV